MIISQEPIFIVGFPRSGTTLLQSLLATQKNLTTFPETHFFQILHEKGISFNAKLTKEDIVSLNESLGEKLQSEREILTITDNDSTKKAFENTLLFLWNKNDSPDKRWIEKTPGHALFMDEIYFLYPHAKFIFIVRNPFNAIFSHMRYFPPNSGENWKDIIILANKWVRFLKKAKSFEYKNANNILFIRYEDFVHSINKQMENICTYLCIDFDKCSLSKYRKKAENVMCEYEYWKKDVIESNIDDFNTKSTKKLSRKEKLIIVIAAYKEMASFKYINKNIFLLSLNRFYILLLTIYRYLIRKP